MRRAVYFAWGAFIVGGIVYGFYQNMDLARQNIDLRWQVRGLEKKVDEAQSSLERTRQSLGEQYMAGAQLERVADDLRRELKQKDEWIVETARRLSVFAEELDNSSQEYDSLKQETSGLQDEVLRLRLENAEYRARLVSVKELKSMIRELKRNRRAEGNRGKSMLGRSLSSVRGISGEERPMGNQGFLMKNGQSTWKGKEVHVWPVEQDFLRLR